MIPVDPRYTGRAEAWLDSVARLTYAKRRGVADVEMDRLAAEVADQRVLLLRLIVGSSSGGDSGAVVFAPTVEPHAVLP